MATYTLNSKENSRRIRDAIRQVFLGVWHPVGIADEPHAQDEYDAYIGRAFELLWAKASNAELNEYLVWSVGQMGIEGSRHSHADVIQALRAIDLQEKV